MKLIKSTKPWNCVLASAAMVMEEPIIVLERLIGHDGSKIIHPELGLNARREGFHFQHIIDVALALGYAITPIEAEPVQTATGHDSYVVDFRDFNSSLDRFKAYLENTKGIIIGPTSTGLWHALAWDGEQCYDPQGKTYSFEDIKIKPMIFWRFNKIKE